MHELSIIQSLIEACSERAGDGDVLRVTVEIGKLSCVLPDALRFCYEVCIAGTPLRHSELEIIEVPGRGRCRQCGAQTEMNDFSVRCACGALGLECIGGEELNIKSMEIA